MTTVFHYTSFSEVGNILGKQRGPAGLVPKSWISLDSRFNSPKAVFGLLEPTPENWVHNPHFFDTWRSLTHDLRLLGYGAVLLEIQIDADKDEAFVGERAHMEGILYPEGTNIPGEFLHTDQSAADEAFMQSMMPLHEYLEGQQARKVGYCLPEVVILNSVPLERVFVSSRQPLIEDDLLNSRDEERDYLVRLITRGNAQPELLTWRTAYEAEHGLLEQQASRGERL